MRATFSYASILCAVGQVLDQISVKSIAIHEEEDGLFVEGYNGEGQLQVQMRYDIARNSRKRRNTPSLPR